jgi:hypothetical protein
VDNFLFFYKTDHFIPCRVLSQVELKMSSYCDLRYKIELPDSTIAAAEEWQLLVTIHDLIFAFLFYFYSCGLEKQKHFANLFFKDNVSSQKQ